MKFSSNKIFFFVPVYKSVDVIQRKMDLGLNMYWRQNICVSKPAVEGVPLQKFISKYISCCIFRYFTRWTHVWFFI